jgi:hypothetical protein
LFLRQWIKEELQLRRLRKEMARLDRLYAKDIAAAKEAGQSSEEIYLLEGERYSQWIVPSDEADIIRTNRLVRKAQMMGLPIPKRSVDAGLWEQTMHFYKWRLTDAGFTLIRREIALENEIRQKPWLNWMTLAISLFSLAIAVAALIVE